MNIFLSRGSAIAKIVGANTVKFNNKFEERVTMYVYEEMINGKKLTEIINEQHENVKYLPGHKLPENVVSIFRVYFTNCIIKYLYNNIKRRKNIMINLFLTWFRKL